MKFVIIALCFLAFISIVQSSITRITHPTLGLGLNGLSLSLNPLGLAPIGLGLNGLGLGIGSIHGISLWNLLGLGHRADLSDGNSGQSLSQGQAIFGSPYAVAVNLDGRGIIHGDGVTFAAKNGGGIHTANLDGQYGHITSAASVNIENL